MGATGGNRTKRYLWNEWQLWVITSNSTRTYETLICRVPSEELCEKHGVGSKLHLFWEQSFVELDLFGRKVWKQSWKRWSRVVSNRPSFKFYLTMLYGGPSGARLHHCSWTGQRLKDEVALYNCPFFPTIIITLQSSTNLKLVLRATLAGLLLKPS